MLSHSDLIFFAGGQQIRFLEALSDDFIALIKRRFLEENLLIAGTSAGAMILSNMVITEGGNQDAQVDEELNLMPGLNLIPKFIIDTHFLERGRFARLAHAVKLHPNLIGVGIETDTALIFEKNHLMTLGCGTVTFINGTNIKYDQKLKAGCILNLTVHLIVPGSEINMAI